MTKGPYAGKARDYAACRPPYPEPAIAALCAAVGLQPSWRVADIASGTGNLTRHLVGRVATVFAVEPEAAMRQQAEESLGGCPAFVSITGQAEATTLPDQSVELITVGQALHWFPAERAQREFDRILRPPGWLALIWNRCGPEAAPDLSGLLWPADCQRFSFPATIREDWAHFLGGVRSAARAPNEGEPGYATFERDQRRAFAAGAKDGVIALEFTTELAVGRLKRPRTMPGAAAARAPDPPR